jgi:hypothetical protein
MNANATRTLISIGEAGASLTVTVSQEATMSTEEPWFHTEITADAFPFGGTLKTVFTLSDLRRWGGALSALQAGTGRVVLGGGRAAELGLAAEPQQGGPPDRVAVSVDLVPSADDPYPKLSYVIFDVSSSWSDVGPNINALA